MIYTVTLNPAVDRELTVPDFAYDTVLRAAGWQVDCGGKGFNVSRMLQELGTRSTALGFAGGYAGQLLRDGLHKLDIATAFVPVAGETRTNVSIVNEPRNRYIKVNEPGPTVSDAALSALRTRIKELARPNDWWVLAGSLPPGVPVTTYAELIDMIQQAGAYAVLDSSGAALQHGCHARPYLVKPNDVEAQKLTGLPVTTLQEATAAGRAIHEKGVAHVVISLGGKGALLLNEHGSWLATPPAIIERNPIGAGDSMVAGLVWALSGQANPGAASASDALRWGVACGAATASMDGTAVGPRELVAELAAQVVIQPQEVKNVV